MTAQQVGASTSFSHAISTITSASEHVVHNSPVAEPFSEARSIWNKEHEQTSPEHSE
jgi:hypothetical protein